MSLSFFFSFNASIFFVFSGFVFSFRRTGSSETFVAIFDEGSLLLLILIRIFFSVLFFTSFSPWFGERIQRYAKEQRMLVVFFLSQSLSLFVSFVHSFTRSQILRIFVNCRRLVVIERTWRRNDIIYSTRCTHTLRTERAIQFPTGLVISDTRKIIDSSPLQLSLHLVASLSNEEKSSEKRRNEHSRTQFFVSIRSFRNIFQSRWSVWKECRDERSTYYLLSRFLDHTLSLVTSYTFYL